MGCAAKGSYSGSSLVSKVSGRVMGLANRLRQNMVRVAGECQKFRNSEQAAKNEAGNDNDNEVDSH